MFRRNFSRLCILAIVCAATTRPSAGRDIFEANRALGRGVNLGNALEAPREGEWGLTIRDMYFSLIKQAGFDTVRLPVKWSAHAETAPPYAIDPKFFQRIDHLLDQAEKHRLNLILNIHHYDALDKEPQAQAERFAALWRQIATRYKDRPESLYFELDNEPHDKLDEKPWNEILRKGLAAVRESNPARPVIIGPPSWNGIWALPKLDLPDDANLIVTVHCYNPFEFTHQGADWTTPKVRTIKNREWNGTERELATMRKELDLAANWGKTHKRPIFLGEFGAYSKAPFASRVKWTSSLARECEARNFSWAYWEFGAGFGVYDRDASAWRKELLNSLIPPAK